jgi:hypothetical protein
VAVAQLVYQGRPHSKFLKKILSGQRQGFENDREAEMVVTQWFQSQAADFYDVYKIWSHGMTNVSIPVVNILKNS